MAPKHSLDMAMSSLPAAKRVRSTTGASLVKPNYRANFDRLCALHNWTPSEAVRGKLADLLQLSGNRLEASELLPLAFVQHYPFIWVKGFLLLGYNDAEESVWYKAYPSGRGLARGRYYNSAQVNILGKHTVTKYWQSWVQVFDIEQRGLDRCHEYFTGVYLILKKFPNLRYKSGRKKEDARNPRNVIRMTGVLEYPFNDDHPFMQETLQNNHVESDETQEALDTETDVVDGTSSIKQEETDLRDQDRSLPLARQLLMQLTSRPNLRHFDSESSFHPQGHTANDQQGLPVNPDGSASPLRRLPVQSDFCAHSHSLDSGSPSRSQEPTTDNRIGAHENENDLSPLPGFQSEQSTSRANSREPIWTCETHLPEHSTSKQSLVQDDTNLSSPSRLFLKKPVFRAYSQGTSCLPHLDRNIADKNTGSCIREAASLIDQSSKNLNFRTSSHENLATPLHSTRLTAEKQVGPRIEDNPAPISQEPKTPSRVPSRKTITSPYFARTRSQPNQAKALWPLELSSQDFKRSQPSQKSKEYTTRVSVEAPRWSNTNFNFAVVTSVSTVPAPVITSIEE